MSCRVLHQQLSWLLDDTEQSQYDISSFFEPFHALDPVMYNPFTQPLWEAALQSFGNKLVPVEKHVARKMKNELASCDSKGEQVCFCVFLDLVGSHFFMKWIKIPSAWRIQLLHDSCTMIYLL